MLRDKFFKKHRKKAQHVIELALMMPFFVILFSFTFQMMVQTFAKFRFSYIFSSLVTSLIKTQPVYTDMDDAGNYDFQTRTEDALEGAIINANSVPFTDVSVNFVNTEKTTYVIGGFQYVVTTIFLGSAGNAYFYYAIPINNSFIEPVALVTSNDTVESFFENEYRNFLIMWINTGGWR